MHFSFSTLLYFYKIYNRKNDKKGPFFLRKSYDIESNRKEAINLSINGLKIGFVLTGSFCTFQKVIPKMKELIHDGAEIIPIMSPHSYELDTKFGKAQDFIDVIEEITKKKIIHSIQEAEPIGPKKMTDIMVVAPCSR